MPQRKQGKRPSHAELVYFSFLRETGEKKQGKKSSNSSGLVHTGRPNHTKGSTNERGGTKKRKTHHFHAAVL